MGETLTPTPLMADTSRFDDLDLVERLRLKAPLGHIRRLDEDKGWISAGRACFARGAS